MSDKRRFEIAIYLAFFAFIMCAPLVLEPFWLNRIAKYLVFGMLGIAVALSWGYAGILNLGQGLFFGAGAYMLAMSLKLASPTSLQQGSDKPVPDFMLWNAEPGSPTAGMVRVGGHPATSQAARQLVAYVPDKGWFWHIPLSNDVVSIGVVGDADYFFRPGAGTRSL